MKNGLLDFLQSASNSVAGNVAGPVDLISMGLLKMGVPVGNSPMGGSEWMKQKGLMRDVPQGPARVLGETAGLLGPAMATQFAPQIAGGLLKAGDNLAAPATLNKQAGAVLWHGSPHKFDSFDHANNLSKGDGFQAQGIGTYLAENPEVAQVYARGGNVYKVDVPDESIASMLDFDAPIMSQRHLSGNLNAIHAADPALKDRMFDVARQNQSGETLFSTIQEKFARDLKASGFAGDVYDESNKLASSAFKKAGLAGFRYSDKGSKGGSGTTKNMVLFNDSLATILERNGQAIK